jgi:single-strand DNA-binding protein
VESPATTFKNQVIHQSQQTNEGIKMASVNKVIIMGNCGRDPEMRYMPDGKAATSISIATTSRRKDKNSGETIEDTQWHRVQFFDRLAEIVGEYVKKGSPVYIEGRLKYGTYVDKTTGVEKNTCDIVATELQLLGGRDQREEAPQQRSAPVRQQAPQRQAPAPQRQARPAPAPTQGSGFDDLDDMVPF